MTEPHTSGSANERASAEAESAARAPNENIRPVLEIIQEVREDRRRGSLKHTAAVFAARPRGRLRLRADPPHIKTQSQCAHSQDR